MKKEKNRPAAPILVTALLLAAVLFSTFSPASAGPARGGPKGTPEPTVEGPGIEAVPSGFFQILSDTGVILYKKDYAGGQPDYVQVVSLDKGAKIALMHGTIASPGKGTGPFGGDNPTFNRNTLPSVWNSFSGSNSGAFCVLNGQFFSTNADPTPLAFSLKKDGTIVSDGYASTTEFPGQRLMLELWSDRADIRTLSKDALYNSSAPNILGGLSELADKDINTYTGRTFAGIDDLNGDGKYETVLFFNSAYSNQPDTAAVLRAFGADKVIMFDGGSSTQLNCHGTNYVSSSRTIPQTIGVVKGGTVSGTWREEYFNGKNFESRCYDDFEDSTYIFRNWGAGAPANNCNSDNFSARFTRTLNFSSGTYTFHCQHDDGCRIYIDGQLRGNWWVDSSFTGNNWTGTLSGSHEVKIEFYEATGNARLEAYWSGPGFLPARQTCTANEWCARYFGNMDLAGTPAIVRNEGNANINKDWGNGGIGYGFLTDYFSVRWVRTANFVAGRYRFHIKVDDGGRLFVNDQKVINQWKVQGATEYTVDLDLPAGPIPLKFEYFENDGQAVARMWWEQIGLNLESSGAQDGWILESTRTSSQGGTKNTVAPALILGDDSSNRQYRSILSFDTSGLPDDAVITGVTLKIKKVGPPVGTNPFTTHGNILVDMRYGAFSNDPALQFKDFQSPASQDGVMAIMNNPVDGWYSKTLGAANYIFINKTGLTQFRLRFRLGDNNDNDADYLKFYSGNALTAGLRPQLIISYSIP